MTNHYLLEAQELKEIAEAYLDGVVNRGFGTMTKNDYEVLLIHLLRTLEKYKDKDNFQMSCALQIPESKVKRLLYEADIRYKYSQENNSEADIKKRIQEIFVKAQVDTIRKRFIVVIEEKYIRTYLSSRLKQEGMYADSSFNSEIMVFNEQALDFIVENFILKNDDAKKIKEEYKQCISNENNIPFSWHNLFVGMAKAAGEEVAKSGVRYVFGESKQICDIVTKVKDFLSQLKLK